MVNLRMFHGINGKDGETKVDPDSFRFHGPMKSLFYKVLSLVNPPPKAWVDDIDGNIGVLRDIYYEYLKHEKQGWRRDVLSKIFPFSLCLSHYDENYEEVVQWFAYQIIQRQNEFKFDQEHKDPYFWYQDGRGRIGLTKEQRQIERELNAKKE